MSFIFQITNLRLFGPFRISPGRLFTISPFRLEQHLTPGQDTDPFLISLCFSVFSILFSLGNIFMRTHSETWSSGAGGGRTQMIIDTSP